MNLATYPKWLIPNHHKICVRSGIFGSHKSENPVVPGTDLCGGCHSRFPRLLADLVGYWAPLQEAHVKRPTKNYAADRVSGGGGVSDAGALWNPAARVAIVELVEWTRFVMRTIIRERRFYPSDILGFVDDTSTPIPIALAQLARHHARWLTSYPTLGPALLADTIRLRLLAMKALDQPPVRHITMTDMFCDEVVQETDYGKVVCGAALVGVIPTDAAWAIETGPALILCSANPAHARIEARDWILTR